jgi:hypothetical protein
MRRLTEFQKLCIVVLEVIFRVWIAFVTGEGPGEGVDGGEVATTAVLWGVA